MSATFADFLRYERAVYGEDLFIPGYDPYLIRYGEYRFLLDHLRLEPGQRVLDIGCEANIFLPFAAAKGADVVGIDINPGAEAPLRDRMIAAEHALGMALPYRFECADATSYAPAGERFDVVMAMSAIEHFFTPPDAGGDGDSLAIATVARCLRAGGLGVVTVPMSNGGDFFEVPGGDGRFGYSYRLYTLEKLYERLLGHPDLDVIDLRFLAQTTPDARYEQLKFHRFWAESLTAQERAKWAWANAILAATFNPAVSEAEASQRPGTMNTALIALRRRVD